MMLIASEVIFYLKNVFSNLIVVFWQKMFENFSLNVRKCLSNKLCLENDNFHSSKCSPGLKQSCLRMQMKKKALLLTQIFDFFANGKGGKFAVEVS